MVSEHRSASGISAVRAVPDERNGGRLRHEFVFGSLERLVQVPDNMRESTAFIYAQVDADEFALCGTCFFVALSIPGHDTRGFVVTVTAHHVLAEAYRRGQDGKAYIRVNTASGTHWAATDVSEWQRHPDDTVDLAILPASPTMIKDPIIEMRAWGAISMATEEVIAREAIGIGDEVFVIGLFRHHPGERNEPILRVGNIAAMPADPIKTKYYGFAQLYMIEARSIAGLSGSPVFVHLGSIRWKDGVLHQPAGPRPFWLLGVMQGHWDRTVEADAATTPDDDSAGSAAFHTGIGVVVPAQKIAEVLELPTFQDIASRLQQRLDSEKDPTDASIGDNSDEFAAFADLAGELVEVPKIEIDAERSNEN